MHWLQAQEDGTYNLQALQLDIVGFLAILGEGSVLANVQVATLSKWIFLPRLIPAPQAMMRPTRPTELETVPGYVSGVKSGNDRGHINHIANIVCDSSKLQPYSVRVVRIRRVDEDRPLKAKLFAPLTFVAIIGFSLSAMLLGLSIYLRDGMSIVATILLSLLSSLIGLSNFWVLKLPKRIKDKRAKEKKVQDTKGGKTLQDEATEAKGHSNEIQAQDDFAPDGDVVIRYPKGSFLVVRCNEDVARELYFAPEEIDYKLKHAWAYRLLSLVGTTMLMGGVICLANARIESQIAWAGSYMLLGALYWIVAALPGKMHWDTSAYEVIPEALSDSTQQSARKGFPSFEAATFTQALWRAIVVSKDTDWVLRSNAIPGTETWKAWLRMAQEKSQEFLEPNGPLSREFGVQTWLIPDWDPQEYLIELLKEEKMAKGRARNVDNV